MEALMLINILASAILFGISSWVVLSPKIHDSLLMRKGLIILSLASMANTLNPSVRSETVMIVAGAWVAGLLLIHREGWRP